MYQVFTGHKEITDRSQRTGFQTYLLITDEISGTAEAYGIDDDAPLDVEALTREVFSDFRVSFQRPPLCGSLNATIITDNRPPDSVVIWESADFYFDSEV